MSHTPIATLNQCHLINGGFADSAPVRRPSIESLDDETLEQIFSRADGGVYQ